MPMTNTQMLINVLEKAQNESLVVYNNGEPSNEGYIVTSKNKAYNVKVEDGKVISCTCPHHQFRGAAICKHMVKVSLAKGIDIIHLSDITDDSPEAI